MANQTQALAKDKEPAAERMTLEHVKSLTGYSDEQIALLKNTVAQGAPNTELAVFLHACGVLQLDPLLRQAYWIRRKTRAEVNGQWQDVYKGALQVGIDGYRAIADRTGVYGGSSEPRFSEWTNWKYKEETMNVPGRAEVTVWKIVQGRNCAFTGVAYWSEFVPPESQAQMYARMPRLMLAKDAEAQALRKAFPALLGPVDYGNTLVAGAEPSGPPAYSVTPVEPAAADSLPAPQKKMSEQELLAVAERIWALQGEAGPPDEPHREAHEAEPAEEVAS